MMAFAATLLAGRYQLDDPIGTGGYCQVWRATDTILSRPVAVKLLHAGYAQQAETLGRFKAEAQHAGSLSHPNIARVYDYGESARLRDGQGAVADANRPFSAGTWPAVPPDVPLGTAAELWPFAGVSRAVVSAGRRRRRSVAGMAALVLAALAGLDVP
jgi:hypothetical protein